MANFNAFFKFATRPCSFFIDLQAWRKKALPPLMHDEKFKTNQR